MEFRSGKRVFGRNCELIPMTDTVIAHVKTLGDNQTIIITLTDRHGRLIGDVETPGVGAN